MWIKYNCRDAQCCTLKKCKDMETNRWWASVWNCTFRQLASSRPAKDWSVLQVSACLKEWITEWILVAMLILHSVTILFLYKIKSFVNIPNWDIPVNTWQLCMDKLQYWVCSNSYHTCNRYCSFWKKIPIVGQWSMHYVTGPPTRPKQSYKIQVVSHDMDKWWESSHLTHAVSQHRGHITQAPLKWMRIQFAVHRKSRQLVISMHQLS